jgi:enterochelin esterase-like enzyme
VSGASEIVERLSDGARLGPGALDRVLEHYSFPVVGDGWAVFVYRGRADEVNLHLWVSGLPSAQPFTRVEGTDLWILQTQLQREARLEYKFDILDGHGHSLIRDPLNPTIAEDPFGANSVVQGLGYSRPEWAVEDPRARKGTVVEHEVRSLAFGEDRPYSLYLPARFRETRRYPLLIVHDGLDYVRYSSLTTVLDNLIHRLEIPPLIAALVQSPNRLVEYGANDLHARFLVEDLLQDLERRYPLLDDPADRGLVGASFGAVASLHAAWSHPGTFGNLLLQSGSFAFTDVGEHDFGPAFDPVVDFVNSFRMDPGHPADQIFVSAGIYESMIYFNRSLLPALQSTGAEVRLVEAPDGHNWENWRDRMRDGFTWLFPGPLWMFYE